MKRGRGKGPGRGARSNREAFKPEKAQRSEAADLLAEVGEAAEEVEAAAAVAVSTAAEAERQARLLAEEETLARLATEGVDPEIVPRLMELQQEQDRRRAEAAAKAKEAEKVTLHTSSGLEVKEEKKPEEKGEKLKPKNPYIAKKTDKLHAPVALQYQHFAFEYDDKNPDNPGNRVLEAVTRDVNKEDKENKEGKGDNENQVKTTVKKLSQVSNPQSDSHTLVINMNTPKPAANYEKGWKFSGHTGVAESDEDDEACDVDHYHGDGKVDSPIRPQEQEAYALRSTNWVKEQQAKGSKAIRNLITMAEGNVTAVKYNPITKKFEWNKEFIQMFETMYPNGAFALSIAKASKTKGRGATNAQGKPTGISSINHQTGKDGGEVESLNNFIVHQRLDKNNKPICNFRGKDLYKYDPNMLIESRKNYKESKTATDHTKAVYRWKKKLFICGSNQGEVADKEWTLPAEKYQETALNKDGSIPEKTIQITQRAYTYQAFLIQHYLQHDFGLNPKEPNNFVQGAFAIGLNKYFDKRLKHEQLEKVAPEETLAYQLTLVLKEWAKSKPYKDLEDISKTPPKLRKADGSADEGEISKVIQRFLTEKKPQHEHISTKIFKMETSGGYMPNESLGGINSAGLGKLQGAAAVKTLTKMNKKESTVVFGGKGRQEGPVNAVYLWQTESSELHKTRCVQLPDVTLSEDKTPTDYIKAMVLQKAVEEGPNAATYYIFRFNGELYFATPYNNEEVRHIPRPHPENKQDATAERLLKIYNKFVASFVEKSSFELVVKDDGDYYDLLFENGIAVKGSKMPTFNQSIQERLHITEYITPEARQTQKLGMFGIFANNDKQSVVPTVKPPVDPDPVDPKEHATAVASLF